VEGGGIVVTGLEDRLAQILERAAAEIRGNAVADLREHGAHGDTLLDPDDLAAYLKIDVRSLRRLRNSDGFPKPIMLGGSPRWRRETIDAWLAEQEEQ
jgi:predicted DNA-binding transcriptional regulator AlpA